MCKAVKQDFENIVKGSVIKSAIQLGFSEDTAKSLGELSGYGDMNKTQDELEQIYAEHIRPIFGAAADKGYKKHLINAVLWVYKNVGRGSWEWTDEFVIAMHTNMCNYSAKDLVECSMGVRDNIEYESNKGCAENGADIVDDFENITEDDKEYNSIDEARAVLKAVFGEGFADSNSGRGFEHSVEDFKVPVKYNCSKEESKAVHDKEKSMMDDYMKNGKFAEYLTPFKLIDEIFTGTEDKALQKKEILDAAKAVYEHGRKAEFGIDHTGYLINHAPFYQTKNPFLILYAEDIRDGRFDDLQDLYEQTYGFVKWIRKCDMPYLPLAFEHSLEIIHRNIWVMRIHGGVPSEWSGDYGNKMKRFWKMLGD